MIVSVVTIMVAHDMDPPSFHYHNYFFYHKQQNFININKDPEQKGGQEIHLYKKINKQTESKD